MGVDVVIALPDNTRVRDVAKVISRLFGCPGEMRSLGRDGEYFKCPTVEVKGCAEVPGMVDIVWRGGTVPDREAGSWYFHYESDEPGFRHVLLPRSRPDAIAAGVYLVEFFGGKLRYMDTADGWDLEMPARPDSENRPEDGDEWDDLQQRILAVKPITKQQTKQYKEFAAYPD